MAKDPAFLFYSSDFLSGVSDLTMEERGQYITLLCLQHQKGHLSKKVISLCVGNATADVLQKFSIDKDGLFFSPRLDIEIDKRREHSIKQRQRAIDGWEKRKATANATALPLENENENKDINIDINKNDEIFKNLISAESWLEKTAMQSTAKFSIIEVKEFLKKYNDMLNVQFEIKYNKTQYCTHFINWLNKQSKTIYYDTTDLRAKNPKA
jgi:hypothetical protein